MTLQEYYTFGQSVWGGETGDGFYKNICAIDFGDTESDFYASVMIVRTGEDEWALGWQIKDGKDNLMFKACTPNVVTKGNIVKLVYGMTKILQKKLECGSHSKIIKEIVQNAVAEAASCCNYTEMVSYLESAYANRGIGESKITI